MLLIFVRLALVSVGAADNPDWLNIDCPFVSDGKVIVFGMLVKPEHCWNILCPLVKLAKPKEDGILVMVLQLLNIRTPFVNEANDRVDGKL